MAALAIRARFPLGTFQGRRGGSHRSPFPDTMRLHAALTHAAGNGSMAIVDGDQLRPASRAVEALKWLELHPPTALQLPEMQPVSESPAFAWRHEGVSDSATKPDRKELKGQSTAFAYDGPLGWAWDEEVPGSIVETIRALCEDVSCLGETESVAVLEVLEIEPTHVGGQRTSDFVRREPGEVRLETPNPGRFDELEQAHREAHPRKRPSRAADRAKGTEHAHAPAPPRTRCDQRGYRPLVTPSAAPWTEAVCLDVAGDIDRTEAVRWAVAVHRSMCALLGEDATPLTTGAYPAGVRQPPNRLAIQLLPTADSDPARFAVMTPGGQDPLALRAIEKACHNLSRVYWSGGAVEIAAARPMDAETYWQPAASGTRRLWRPVLGLVPDTRIRSGRPAWTFRDSALVAAGLLLRDRFEFDGQDRYRKLAEQVARAGVRVGGLARIPDSRIERYAYKTPPGVVVHPYTGWFDLNGLVPERALFALGQSRHLGGGLMYPVDVPVDVAEQVLGQP